MPKVMVKVMVVMAIAVVFVVTLIQIYLAYQTTVYTNSSLVLFC